MALTKFSTPHISSHISLEAWMQELKNFDKARTLIMRDPDAKSKPEIKFGFPEERMTLSGDYICKVPGLAEIAIHKDFNYVIWRLMGTSKVIRTNCDGLLQALGIIYEFFKQHEQSLPPEVRSLMEKLQQENEHS